MEKELGNEMTSTCTIKTDTSRLYVENTTKGSS
jgi:hypothetical protein